MPILAGYDATETEVRTVEVTRDKAVRTDAPKERTLLEELVAETRAVRIGLQLILAAEHKLEIDLLDESFKAVRK